MILLDSTTKSIEVLLSGAVSAQLPLVANWIDIDTSATDAVSAVDSITTVTNDTTPVTLVAAPGASTTRQVKYLSVQNENTASVTAKVRLNNGGTFRVLIAVLLAEDETLLYIDGLGIQVISSNGEQKENSILINLTNQVTGVLPVANGGTGDSTLTAHGVLIGEGTSAVAATSAGTSGQPLLSGGGAADPNWGTLGVAFGGTGDTTLTAHGVLMGNGTSPVSASAAGTTGYPFVSGGASADGAYAVLKPVGGGVAAATVTLTDGATPALDASLGTVFRLAAAGDRTIAVPTNPTPGQKIVIQHFASAAGRTLSLNTGAGGFRFGSDITSLSQTASGKTDYIGAIYNDTDSKWDVVAVTKGF